MIHGQVLIGWGSQLHPERYLVVDDTLSESEWEQDLYRLGLPEDTEALFASTERARGELDGWKREDIRSILLTRDLHSMRRLGEGGGLRGERVNLGGLHHASGRIEVLSYVHLSPSDRDDLLALRDQGARVAARDVPGAAIVELDAILQRLPDDTEPARERGDG